MCFYFSGIQESITINFFYKFVFKVKYMRENNIDKLIFNKSMLMKCTYLRSGLEIIHLFKPGIS